MGGEEHVVENSEQCLDNLAKGIDFRVDTLCQKNLKYNIKYGQFRQKSGLVRNLCVHCQMQYELEPIEKTAEETERDRRNKELPF